MKPRTQFAGVLLSLLLLLLLLGCGGSAGGSDATPIAAETMAAIDTRNVPDYPDPALALPEAPLTGIPRTPNVMVVAARQGIAELATFLHTTPNTLRYVNPRLPDPVAPGTLVVIPPIYRSEGETLADVAEKIGLAPALLQEANLSVALDAEVEAGTLLAVPPLYIVLEDTPLGTAAATLGTDDTALLSANPTLQGNDQVLAGTVLVVPPAAAEQE